MQGQAYTQNSSQPCINKYLLKYLNLINKNACKLESDENEIPDIS